MSSTAPKLDQTNAPGAPEKAAPQSAQPFEADAPHARGANANARLGRVVSVSGSHVLISLDPTDTPARVDIGALMRLECAEATVLGQVCAMSVPAPGGEGGVGDIRIVEVELVGELAHGPDGAVRFRKGVGRYPSLGDAASAAGRDVLAAVYAANAATTIRLGALKQDPSIPATAKVNEMLSRHFSVLGTTGSGKSCAIALMMRSILQRSPNAHIVLLDPHGEYRSSFGKRAEVLNSSNLELPYWMLNFEEFVEILYPGRRADRTEIDILSDLIPAAKRTYAKGHPIDEDPKKRLPDSVAYGVDTPVPYRMSDVIASIDAALGKLDNAEGRGPYKRLRTRINGVITDARFAFMFGSLTVRDNMATVIGRILRVPVDGKPVTILDLSGIPSEVVNVLVSVLARITFDFGLWSDGAIPVTLICEEAHRYAPSDEAAGFRPTRKALARIAKEGRKYGLSLGVVSQRPMELDPTILSQCNTIFAMRLANREDRDTLRAAVPEASTALIDCLPSLGLGEAVAVGEGVALPTRLRFDPLPRDAIPRCYTASFTKSWSSEVGEPDFMDEVVSRWRTQQR